MPKGIRPKKGSGSLKMLVDRVADLHFTGCSQMEIARIVGKTPSAIQSIVSDPLFLKQEGDKRIDADRALQRKVSAIAHKCADESLELLANGSEAAKLGIIRIYCDRGVGMVMNTMVVNQQPGQPQSGEGLRQPALVAALTGQSCESVACDLSDSHTIDTEIVSVSPASKVLEPVPPVETVVVSSPGSLQDMVRVGATQDNRREMLESAPAGVRLPEL